MMENLEQSQPEVEKSTAESMVAIPETKPQSFSLFLILLSLFMFVLGGVVVFAYFTFLKPGKVVPQPIVSPSVAPIPTPPSPIEGQTKDRTGPVITDNSGRVVVAKVNYPSEFKGVSMRLHIADDQMNLLSEPEIVNGYPNYLPGSHDFLARIISFSGEVLGEYGFGEPRRILGEPGYQGPTWLEEVDFTLTIPYFENAKIINIFSATKLMLSIDISNLSSEK